MGGGIFAFDTVSVDVAETPVLVHFGVSDGSYLVSGSVLLRWGSLAADPADNPPGVIECSVPGTLLAQPDPSVVIAQSSETPLSTLLGEATTEAEISSMEAEYLAGTSIDLATDFTVTGGNGFDIACATRLAPGAEPQPATVEIARLTLTPGTRLVAAIRP